VDDGDGADAGEKSATEADTASVRSAARFEPKLVVRYVARYVPKHRATSATKPAVNRGVK
jgi:hypothetical protein